MTTPGIRSMVAAGLVVAIVAIVRCTGEAWVPTAGPGATPGSVRVELTPTPSPSTGVEKTQAGPSASSAGAGASAPVEPPAATTTKELESRHSDAPRLGFDLVKQFLVYPLDVETRILLRHEVLNPGDLELSGAQISQLDSVVAHYREVLEPSFRHWFETRNQEVIDMVRGGHVEASASPPVPEYRIQSLARKLLKVAHADDPGLTLAELESRLRANPPPGEMEPASHVQFQGRIFKLASIDDMPLSDPMYEEVHFHCSEFLGVVCFWFEQNAGAKAGEVGAVIERAMNWRASDTRRVR